MILRNKFTVHPTSTFKKEFQKIMYYIKFKLKKPLIADNFYEIITNEISSLNFMPERYMKIYDFRNKDKNLRKLSVKEYVIIYNVNRDTRTSFHFTYFS